jgi:hypothetical protein
LSLRIQRLAVEVRTAPRFEAGAPKALFEPRIPGNGLNSYAYFRYDVAADGKRFLVNSVATTTESSAAAPLTVVRNWQAALKH